MVGLVGYLTDSAHSASKFGQGIFKEAFFGTLLFCKGLFMLKKIYLKIDDRREKVEDFIADNILKRRDELKNVDDLRKAGSLAVINAVSAYISSYGLPALTDDVKDRIADANVKVLKRLNKKLQNQLKKKSKSYISRHGGENV